MVNASWAFASCIKQDADCLSPALQIQSHQLRKYFTESSSLLGLNKNLPTISRSLPEWVNTEALAKIKDLTITKEVFPVQKSPTENDEEFQAVHFYISYKDETGRVKDQGSIKFWVYQNPEGVRLFKNKTNRFNIRGAGFYPELPRGLKQEENRKVVKAGVGISLRWLLMAQESDWQGKTALGYNAEPPSLKVFANLRKGDKWPSWEFSAKPLFVEELGRPVEFQHISYNSPLLTQDQKEEVKDFFENKINFIDKSGKKITVFPELETDQDNKYRDLKEIIRISLLDNLYQTEQLVPGSKLGELCDDLNKENGIFPTPIIVTQDPKTGMIIVLDGNHRFLASKQIDLAYIPMLFVPWEEFDVGVWDRGVEVINAQTMERLIKEFNLKPYDGTKDPHTAVIHYAGKSYVFDVALDKLEQHKAAKDFISRLDELDKDVNVDNAGKTVEEAEALIPVPGWLVIQLPTFTKEDIVKVLGRGEILPPKSFRTRLPTGPLGLPINMEFIKNLQERPELYIDGLDSSWPDAKQKIVEWVNRRLQQELEWIDFVELPQEMNVSETDKFRFPVKLAPVIKNHEAEFLILDKIGIYNLNPLNFREEISRVLTPKFEFEGGALTLLENFVAAADMIVAHGFDVDISMHHRGKTLNFDEVKKRSRHELMLMHLYEGDDPVIINVKGPSTLDLEEIFNIYEEIVNISINTQDHRHPLFQLRQEDKFVWIQESVKFLGDDFLKMTQNMWRIASESKSVQELCSSAAFSLYKDRKLHRLRLLGADDIIEAGERLPHKYSFILDEDPFLNDEQFWKDEEKAKQITAADKDLNEILETSYGDAYKYLVELERRMPKIYDAATDLFIHSNLLFEKYDTPAQYVFLGRATDLVYWATKFMFKERIFSEYHLLDFTHHGGMTNCLNLGLENPEALDKYLQKIGLNKNEKVIIIDEFGASTFLHNTVSLFESLGYEDVNGINISEDIAKGTRDPKDYNMDMFSAMSWLADDYNPGRIFEVKIEDGRWTYEYRHDFSNSISLTINRNGKYLAWLNRLVLYRHLIEREKQMRVMAEEMKKSKPLRKPPVFNFEAFFIERAL